VPTGRRRRQCWAAQEEELGGGGGVGWRRSWAGVRRGCGQAQCGGHGTCDGSARQAAAERRLPGGRAQRAGGGGGN